MTCASALSTDRDADSALSDVVDRVARAFVAGPADLAVVFATSHHAETLGRVAQEVRRRGLARHVLGCSAESVIGEDREVEAEPALSFWAIQLPGVELTPRRLTFDGAGLHGWEGVGRDSTLILLGDPFSFPADQFLKTVNAEAPGFRVVGGMASAGAAPGRNRLVLDDRVHDAGAVAVGLGGPVGVRTVVSQGCRPIGRSMVVTRAESNILRELGGRPAMEVLREVFDALDEGDQERVQQGLHIGRVINEYQPTFGRGDFLVRNVLGADDAGGIAVSDVIRVGQTVQFHVRDADSADDDLHTLLAGERSARPGLHVRGALVFSCNGRGTRLFGGPNHDVATLHEQVGPVPAAGFFAMGELGPVGGQNFVHGFTASVALFEDAGG